MTEPLSTVCDHCGAKLKLKNPDLEGKKIKCPKCEETFVAMAADSKPAATKPAKRKKASDDDDLDFMDVDPDDYGPPLDEDDDVEDDDSPRERPARSSRGGRKKSKKKKSKRNGNAAQVVKIVAGILLVMAVLGGGGFALMSLAKGSGISDLDWLPTDVQGFVKVQVDDVWGANVSQPIKNSTGGQKFVAEMTKNVGVGPQDVDQLIVSVPANSPATPAVTLVRFKKPLAEGVLQSANPDRQSVSHLGSSYLKTANNTAAFQPDPKTLILGPESAIQALIARGKTNPSEAKFAFARNYRDHFVMALLDPAVSPGSSMPGRPTSGNPFSFGGGQNTSSLLVRANAASDIRLTALATYKTAETAKSDADKMKADLEKGKANITQTKTQMQSMPPNPLIKTEQVVKLMNGAEQVMNSVQISQSGLVVNVQANVTGQLVNDFSEFASSMPGAGLPMGFPTPFGSR